MWYSPFATRTRHIHCRWALWCHCSWDDSRILRCSNYETQITSRSKLSAEEEENYMHEISARRHFHVIMKTFYSKFATRIGTEWVHPMFIVKLCLVKFAAALILYRSNIHDKDAPCTEEDLLAAITTHFETDHDDLVPALNRFCAESARAESEGSESEGVKSAGWLTWKGPDVHIEERATIEQRWKAGTEESEARQHSVYPIYM